MTRSVLFDTETTGLDPTQGHRVLEIAAIELIHDLMTGTRSAPLWFTALVSVWLAVSCRP